MGEIKFVHTNIISRDWKALSHFYISVFGCEMLYPERDLSGEWIDAVTNIKDVHIRGIQLRLPGYSNGPTLEIFQYDKFIEGGGVPDINRCGFAHIAFLVDDVEYYLSKLVENGGSRLGEVAKTRIEGVGLLTVVYARDPEGNIIELQNWK